MSLRPGMTAPDFELEATVRGDFQKIKLSDFRGKWVVLFFYPADFTFVCPTEIAAFAARDRDLREKDVQVLAASIDTKFAHKIWQEGELARMIPDGVPFPMLSDLSGRVGKLYEVYDENLGLDLRGVFIIDPDGVLQSVQVLNAPVGASVLLRCGAMAMFEGKVGRRKNRVAVRIERELPRTQPNSER